MKSTSKPPASPRRTLVASALAQLSLAQVSLASALLPRPAGAQAPVTTTTTMSTIVCTFDRHRFTASLDDNPSARDLLSMLPLDVVIEDYSTNEKIARLPRKLTEEGSGPFGNEAPADLCYFAPWGNLAFFHAGYRYSPGLIRLGRVDAGVEPLLTRGTFPLRLSAATGRGR